MWRRLTLKGKLAGERCRHISYRKSGQWQTGCQRGARWSWGTKKKKKQLTTTNNKQQKKQKNPLWQSQGFCTFFIKSTLNYLKVLIYFSNFISCFCFSNELLFCFNSHVFVHNHFDSSGQKVEWNLFSFKHSSIKV